MALTPEEIQETIDEFALMSAYSVDFDEVEGALRPTERACQYFLSGLASWCIHWDSEDHKCLFEGNDTFGNVIIPSLYNDGNCDFLGRASKCSQYEATGETDEGYYCIAPNMFFCGLGTKDADGFFHAIPREQIKGYNEVDGVGRCDGEGKGTGTCGYIEGGDPDKCPVVCNYYRPYRMGFGAKEPQSFESVLRGDPAPAVLDKRLPLAFSIYNLRARFQKCAYWESAAGQFQIDSSGRITIDVTPFDQCTCEDVVTWDYLEMDGNSPEWILDGVWANGAGCTVCNGAKPECPYYTEKWLYVVDDKMQDGNKISAQQILELRYWLKFWVKQSEYEFYFNNIRPNRSDPTTSSIFTFLKWERLGETSTDAIGVGNKVKLLIKAGEDKEGEEGGVLDGGTFGLTSSVKKSEAIDGDSMFFIGGTLPNVTVHLVNTTMVGKYLSCFDDKDLKSMLTIPIHVGYPSEEDLKTKEFVESNLKVVSARYQKIGQEIGARSTQEVSGQISFPSLVRDINKIFNEDEDKLIDFYRAISRYVKDLLKNNSEFIKSANSDENGYFTVGPLPLKYQTNNKLVLIIEVGDGTWGFQRVDIWSQWYGGLIIQNEFENKFENDDAGYTDSLPERFSGKTTIRAGLKPISGINSFGLNTEVGDVIPITSVYAETQLYPTGIYSYSYFVKSTICEDIIVDEWMRLGFSVNVIAKIDDINLNYLYFWEIISATMFEISDDPNPQTIEMKVVYPSNYSFSGNSVIQPNDEQRYIDPTMFVIKPKDDSVKIGFRNSEWELHVDYKYTELVNEDPAQIAESDECENIWPLFDSETISYSPVDFSIEQFGNEIGISNINAKSVKVLANFTDEEGRLMSAVATKLCTMVTKIFCRNVDIKYGYRVPAIGYKLRPQSGLATEIYADQIYSSELIHGFNPPCRDHEYYGDYGFMWYPFQACNGKVVYYSRWAGAAFCTAPYGEITGPEMYRDDYRFCGPVEYKAFTAGGGGMADCVVKWAYRYSKSQGDFYFSGRANIKGIVDLNFYSMEGWALPSFGNKGREMTTRFMSQDYHGHLNFSGPKVTTTYEWMPMVMDNEMFFTSFNAFDETAYIDCFSSYNQLNFYLSDQIEEKYVMEGDDSLVRQRFKFEELFTTRTFIFCSYPHPLSADGKAVFYQFKNEDHAWAWREIWKDIERDSDSELVFMFFEKPPYSLCREKKYHQYICHEGAYVIKYNAPKLEEGVMVTYPSIALGEGPKRHFNPLYSKDDYGIQRVEWKDVTDGEVGGEAGGIYHKTTVSGNWNHNENLIFDSEAVNKEEVAKAADREFKDPTDEMVYAYNRGVIVNLWRNRLKYMPFKEIVFSTENQECDYLSYSISPIECEEVGGSIWFGGVILTYDIVGVCEEGACISKIVIMGNWGKFTSAQQSEHFASDKLFCMPGVEVKQGANIEDANILSQSEFKFVKIVEISTGWADKSTDDWQPYELEIELDITPFRMLDAESKKEKLFVSLYMRDEQAISVSEMVFYEAKYKNAIEIIDTWEQKYIVSEGNDFGDYNLNGPESTLSFERNMEYSGQYFPAGPNCAYKEKTKTLSKMRSVYAGVETAEDTPLTVNRETLLEIESEEQMKLYKEAYELDEFGNKFFYEISMPKYLSDFFENNNISYNIKGLAKFVGERLDWGKHALYKAYKSGEFWSPKGHKFEWSKNVLTQKCRLGQYGAWIGAFGPVETIHDADLIHMDTQEYTETMNVADSLYTGRMEYQWQVYTNVAGAEPLDAAASPLGIGGTFVDTKHIAT